MKTVRSSYLHLSNILSGRIEFSSRVIESSFSTRLDTFSKKFQFDSTLFESNTRLELEYSTWRNQSIHTVMNHINALKKLCINCWLSALSLFAITRHEAILKSLMLYDHEWYESSSSISLEYLETICSSCFHLMILNLNQRNCNFKVWLQSKFE